MGLAWRKQRTAASDRNFKQAAQGAERAATTNATKLPPGGPWTSDQYEEGALASRWGFKRKALEFLRITVILIGFYEDSARILMGN